MNFSEYPLIQSMKRGEEVLWLNENMDNKLSEEVTKSDIKDASERLMRFAPYLSAVFPDTGDGIIESKIIEIPKMKGALEQIHGSGLDGRLLLKCDCNLPVSGSIKARGGIYEVLHFAEGIALKSGMLKLTDNYAILADEKFRKLFSEYSIAVGSTGNLGLSIGIMGAKLGFKVTVHMSCDAKQWKKELLREKGATVVEYGGDYGKAVAEGRRQAESDDSCHFVDDENSKTLFLGYSVAAERLEKQLRDEGVTVDTEHPLFVYLPCGVGGGPGGVAYGLKQIYGENVHCFFAEPVEAPCMLLGVMTGKHEKICVQDIGLSGKTSADGLAVSRPSGLVGRLVGNLLDGLYSVSDEKMERFVADLYDTEGVFSEPSGTAGFAGFYLIRQFDKYRGADMKNSTHIVWSTGGSMVPAAERDKLLENRRQRG